MEVCLAGLSIKIIQKQKNIFNQICENNNQIIFFNTYFLPTNVRFLFAQQTNQFHVEEDPYSDR